MDQEWYFWIVDRLATEFRLNDGACADWWEAQGRLPLAARFVRFLQAVVLAQVPGRIVIFLDEIDTTRSLDFTDDFFAALRECYERRSTEPEFRRLAFVLLGVSTPSDLMVDKVRSRLILGGRSICRGFSLRKRSLCWRGWRGCRMRRGRCDRFWIGRGGSRF
ncbi:MAG: hypothetical protein HC860_25855 [Alkalinema sp. RU_4_3]|nr:hypothetical protein [Alkalinema sp. RU_4_3]